MPTSRVLNIEFAGGEPVRPASSSFPPPPMAVVSGAQRLCGGEPINVRLPGGEKLTGTLVDFRTDAGTVSWRPSDGGVVRTTALADVKLVQVMVDARWPGGGPTAAAQRDGEPGTADAMQPGIRDFEVVFEDGDSLRGRTSGFRRDRHGLYLFPLLDDERYFCSFVPHGFITRHTVGPLIGELLVSEGSLDPDALDRALAAQETGRHEPLGQSLVQQAAVTAKELEAALERQQANLRQVRIGELLLEEGLITRDQLEEALTRQKARRGKPLGEILVEMHLLRRTDLYGVLARKLSIPSVDLRKFYVDPEVVKLVPREIIRKHHVLPLYTFNGRMVLATENPLDWTPAEAVSFATGMHVDPVIATREEIDRVVDIVFNTYVDSHEHIELDFSAYTEDPDDDALSENQYGDNMVVTLVNQMIGNAYKMGASDIHIEPNSKTETLVRVRKDGQMRTLLQVPAKLRRALVARIKVMAGLNIAERRKPQDGRINLRRFTKMDVELRVATLPTVGGNEDVVMRVLARRRPVPLDKLELGVENHVRLLKALNEPYGMFLVTGPTGSGKSTTMQSLLQHLNDGERKIWTAEDPVEMSQPGLRQLQVNPQAGLGFPEAMRAFLRADPDVIMVGEIRDRETASVAVEASLTGHLMFSTLHTNNSVETVTRLLDMGMDPFNFSDALVGVLSQRLARRLCTDCRESREPDPGEIEALAREYCQDLRTRDEDDARFALRVREVTDDWRSQYSAHGDLRLYRPGGCVRCESTGYRGRLALHELLVVYPGMKRLIQQQVPSEGLRERALCDGMRTLRQDGIEKVVQGLTEVHEVRKVCAR